MTRRVVIASDLDRTLIYSRAAAGLVDGAHDAAALEALRCIEQYRGEPASFMTATAAEQLVGLARDSWLVPVTTRTREQLARVELPGGPSEWAVAANGATILHNGEVDADWAVTVTRRLASSQPLDGFRSELRRHFQLPEPGTDWLAALREADGVFCYAVVDRAAVPVDFLAEAAVWAQARGWRMSLQGRKVYWVPQPLTKSAAVAAVADRVGADRVLAAGDSLLDLDLLLAADRGIVAAHGELASQLPPNGGLAVTAARGVAAGEEIAHWFRRNLDSATPSMWSGSQAIVG